MHKIFFFYFLCLAESYLNDGLFSVSITRHHKGDIFIAQEKKCYKDLCTDLSSGTGEPNGNSECECKCVQNNPVFRDDLNICVDDVPECTLLPFASSTAVKKIPYVFLPLKGQIVYPSAEIIISDVGAPVCVVSGGQYLGRSGWLNLRNNSGVEPPFRLFRDEGRTYLQWLGETSLRMAMEGRIILVHLMCKDASSTEAPKIFTPCLAFRVAGNPNIREMMFATDIHLKEEYSGGLSVREYIAIGICSLLLAVVYVASVFFYLHWRKKRQKENEKTGEDSHLTLGEEGIIKSNPLLQANRHLIGGQDNAGYISDSNSCCSDADQTSDLLCLDDEDVSVHQNMQTSAIIHPCDTEYGGTVLNQDSNTIEKLPEENVSIVETLEAKEEHSEMIKGMGCGSIRRKLYFNPSYFEPDLLKAPPPAALEFLVKIREVIAIAKHKMSAKKFSPSLLGIPEEEGSWKADSNSIIIPQSNITKNLTAENCEIKKPRHTTPGENIGPINFHLASSEFYCPIDAKQRIIRKWLEDVPVPVQTDDRKSKDTKSRKLSSEENKILNKSKLWQMNESATNKVSGEISKTMVQSGRQEKKRPSTKGRAPPLPPQTSNISEEKKECLAKIEFPILSLSLSSNTSLSKQGVNSKPEIITTPKIKPPCPPPLPIFNQESEEVPRVQGKDRVPPAVAKNLMDAVIQELTSNKMLKSKRSVELVEDTFESLQVDADNSKKEVANEIAFELDKTLGETQDEEINRNSPEIKCADMETINSNTTTPLKKSGINQDDHEYEIILLNTDDTQPHQENSKDLKIYNLPELMSKSERNEGYSLVSEVYVNDGYSCCSSGESPPSSYSNSSVESERVRYEMLNEKPGRLTIHVNDSSEQYRKPISEVDNFEPDTLDRKPHKSKQTRRNSESEKYSNQMFHEMKCCVSSNNSGNHENFTDSLERPSIMLKTNGSFKQNSVEQNIDNLFRNFNWNKVENFGSLREIYEAKSKNNRRRTETTSLIDCFSSDAERNSTLSWSEERRNKLLHRGIILHIDEEKSRKHKTKAAKIKSNNSTDRVPPLRPPKPTPSPRSRSQSPSTRPNNKSTFSKSNCTLISSPVVSNSPNSPRSISPPLPPPRSLPVSPLARSATSSPIASENTITSRKVVGVTSPQLSGSSVFRYNSSCKNSGLATPSSTCTSPIPSSLQSPFSSLTPSICSVPPRPPKEPIDNSPPLPPRNTKPPLPPKNIKNTRQKPVPSKFATRPLPPLPSPRPTKEISPSTSLSYKDPETLSTLSGASMDSLNSSDYEAFYALPYEEEEEEETCDQEGFRETKNSKRPIRSSSRACSNNITIMSSSNLTNFDANTTFQNNKSQNSKKEHWRGMNKTTTHRLEDSGYLSTDSNDSCPPQMIVSPGFPKIPEKLEPYASQNSETEESLCDGASESGAESIATDSFFYGNFQKKSIDKSSKDNVSSEIYPYSLRLSDVEVNSDTERHYLPIMVHP